MKTIRNLLIMILSLLTFSLFSQTINVPADFATIQEAINEATDGSTIIIANGNYVENLSISAKNLTIASDFLNTENQADVDATIIRTTSGRVFSVSGTAAFTVEIIGLTIRDGSISGLGTGGAGIYQTGAVMVVNNCKFIGNSVSGSSGGAIQVWDARATIKNSYFSGNTASSTGGAVHTNLGNNGRYTIIENCVFENNTANTFGGAISANLSTNIEFKVSDSYIQDNNANNGGGIYLSIANTTGPTPEVRGNIIANNTATTSGGGVYVTGRTSRFTNNTIVKNSLENHGETNKGAGMYFTGSTNFTTSVLRNNIVKLNADEATDKEIYIDYTGTNCKINMYYNCISAEADDLESANANASFDFIEGNITDDPLFIDFANNDFNLQETSPCIDAGDPDSNSNGISWVNDEEDRDPDGTRLDIGALYYHQNIDPQISADFTFFSYGEFAPLSVEFFQNTIWINTEAPTTWEWDFNNDGNVNSYEENPTFVFETPGTYTVSLTVSNGTVSNTVTKTEIIVVEDSGYELEQLVFDFTQIEFLENLCDEVYIDQNVYFNGTNSDPSALTCDIYITHGVDLLGDSDLFIADFFQVQGEVLEVAIKFWDNCGINCTGGRIFSGVDLISEQANPGASSGNQALSFKFKSDIDNPIDLFHFFGMESGLLKMYVKKIKQPEECEISAQIDVYEISCNEFAVSEFVEQNGEDYLVQWFVNGIEVDAEDISPITLEPGENTITLIVTDIDDEECNTTVERTITVYNPDVTLNTNTVALDLEFEVIVDGIDDFNFSWYFGDSGLGSGDDDQLAGTYTYTQEGTYEIAFTIMPLDNFSCAFNYSWEVTVGQTSDCDQGVIEGILDADLAVLVGDIISIELYKNIFIAMILVETTNINEDGEFIFENLEEGTYLLRAVINNPEDYPEYVVTYFNNLMAQAFQWQQASPIVLECDQTATIDLSMITIQDLLTGNGSASGYVFYSSEYDKNTAGTSNKNNQIGYEAAENIRVLLIDNDTHELVAQTQTGENGYYYFTQIPEGDYMISIDVVGYEHISNHVITITENESYYTHLDYAIGNQEILQAEIAVLDIEINGNGTVLINDILFEKTVLIDKNEDLELFANADQDWIFVSWTGDIISGNNPVIVNMNEDKNISVSFEFETFVKEVDLLLNVYPNPFSDHLRIEGAENYHTLVVYNNLGVQVSKKPIEDSIMTLNTTELTNGVYYVVLSGNYGEEKVFKIVKIN